MSSLKVLIVGGGIAGPALAFWLARAGHRVTIVERCPALRASGAQIDIRAQGIDMAKRMGLLDIIRSKVVDEDGVAWVNEKGDVKATILANKSGQGAQSLTSEYEVMRGDLVRILFDATKDHVEYNFGRTVDNFKQDEQGVTAYFSDGVSERFDVLVGADGQGSRIRKAILPPNAPDVYNRVGILQAYWMMPTIEGDSSIRKACRFPGRGMMVRTHSPTESQGYFMIRDDTGEFSSVPRASVEKQKEFFASKFRGSSWQTARFLEGMEKAETFYCHEVVQVKTDTLYKGRVVLLGDAGYCPSPMTGMGTSSAFVGAYVLAGEIIRHSENLTVAFSSYDSTMRPFIAEAQKLSPMLKHIFLPTTQLGINLILFIFQIVTWLRIPELVSRFSSEDKGGWKVPVYPELNAAKSA